MVAENIGKMKKNKTNETEKNLCGRGEFRQILQSGEKMPVDQIKGGNAHLNLKRKTLIEWKESTD